MPATTRQKILEYLKRNQVASSREVARALRMTPANARHHLGILATDGRVELVSQQRGGRGRPEKLYRLAGTLVGDNLSALVDVLLTEAGEKVKMDALGRMMAGAQAETSDVLMRRLSVVVARLNEMHYHARWEAGAAGPRIVLGHCPYVSVIGSHPRLCEMDTALIGTLLGKEVDQTSKLERGAGGRPFCVFAVIG